MFINIDVIIPSYRLSTETLLPILNLTKPTNALVNFYLVADNPGIKPDAAILAMVEKGNVNLLINSTNLGASATRNRGIEAGNAEWLLFLDDDISVPADLIQTYANAIAEHPDEIGFIGVVDMPAPPTIFAKAVVANGSMGIFTVAKEKPSFAWGATANIMVKRQAVGQVRFSDDYPKSGGGEEVEFFLRVRAQNNFTNYRSLPLAAVEHPWWKDGKDDFIRFFRYGKGNSFLAERNQLYQSYNLLNTSETLLLCCVLWLCTFYSPLLHFVLATVLIEYLVTILRVRRSTKSTHLILSAYVAVLRNVYEAGILAGNLLRGRIQGIGERFNYEGGLKKHHFRLNRFMIIKLLLYAVAVVIIAACA